MPDPAEFIGPFLTVVGTLFIVELTDKDALLLLSLATTKRPVTVFAAGAVAFTISSAIIVLVGSALVSYVPVSWIKVTGGGIMLAYGVWNYARGLRAEESIEREGERLRAGAGRRELSAFLVIVSTLVILDIAGDATELVTILFVAQYGDILLVFVGAVVALASASGLEAILGNRLGRILSTRGAMYLSTVVLLAIGTVIVVTSALGL